MQHVHGADYVNELPILTLATDRITFPVAGSGVEVANEPSPVPEWMRWNDYGIGLLRKGGKSKGELRGAEEAFTRVEALGRPDGPLNLARVYFAQGTVQSQAIAALEHAASFDPPTPPWTVAWFTGLVNKQNGFLDEAIANFRSILELDDAATRRRGFDFGRDYRVINELGQTLFERARGSRKNNSLFSRPDLRQIRPIVGSKTAGLAGTLLFNYAAHTRAAEQSESDPIPMSVREFPGCNGGNKA